MREENKILERYGRETGFTVPEGYFETLRAEVASKLPERPAVPVALKLSTWQKIRPYVYLAAMFVGIWCMMKVFHTLSAPAELDLDNLPSSVALAMANTRDDQYIEVSSDFTETELMESLSSSYSSIDEFEADFGYELKPEYADMAAN